MHNKAVHTLNQSNFELRIKAFNGMINEFITGVWAGNRINYIDNTYRHISLENTTKFEDNLHNKEYESIIEYIKKYSSYGMKISYKNEVTQNIINDVESYKNNIHFLEGTLIKDNMHITRTLYKKNELFNEDDFKQIYEESYKIITDKKNSKESKKEYKLIILDQEASGLLTSMIIGYLLEGDRVASKTSFLFNHIHNFSINPSLTISDELSESLPVYYTVDEEGIKPQKKQVLIEKGVIKSYITDKASADILKVNNIGRSRAEDYRYINMPRMSNVVVNEGEISFEHLLKEVYDGYYCVGVSGAAVDVASGVIDVNFQAVYEIENGEITTSINKIGLAVDIYEFLNYVKIVGKNSKTYYRFMGKSRPLQNHLIGFMSPYILLEGCYVK